MTRYFGVHTLEGEWHSLLPRYVLLADRVEGTKVLDVGCGTGIGASLLLELGAESVNAIDHRPEVVELARVKHAKQGLNFHVMFWEELDFPDDTFDMVLCLDPTSPVTDPSLLHEIKRVLNPGGEYICSIERRTVDGIETLLPRYGYSSTGEELSLTPSEERVPQIGQLDDFFETIVSVVQRPRYSFVFDFPGDDEHAMRRTSESNDESGLWVGEDPNSEAGSAEQTDKRAGRWLNIDRQLSDRDGDPAAVEVLYCGDEHMPPPSPREVEMPYRGLVDRLHQLFSELQLRQHPSKAGDEGDANPFKERNQTSEFRAPSQHSDQHRPLSSSRNHHRHTTSDSAATTVRYPPRDDNWRLLQQQLDHMTNLYREVRSDMQDLFVQTRQELAERDRYIEQLVDTFHRWRRDDLRRQNPPPQEFSAPQDSAREPDSQDPATETEPDQSSARGDSFPTQRFRRDESAFESDEDNFDRAPTTIFRKPDSSAPLFDDDDDDELSSTSETDDGTDTSTGNEASEMQSPDVDTPEVDPSHDATADDREDTAGDEVAPSDGDSDSEPAAEDAAGDSELDDSDSGPAAEDAAGDPESAAEAETASDDD